MTAVNIQTELNDFIVVGEFNEKVGPCSKKIITHSGQPIEPITEVFDVESFVLKVMSVEMNTDSTGDCNFITTVDDPKCKAIIQHISLPDLFARGYVRRIVVAYITQDIHNKILNYFALFQDFFHQITDLLLEKSRELFDMDVKRRFADLSYTEEEVQKEPDNASPSILQIKDSREELVEIYEKFLLSETHDIERNQESDNESKKIGDVLPTIENYTPKRLTTLQHAESLTEQVGRSLEDITGSNWERALSVLSTMLKQLSKSDLVLYLEIQDQTAMSHPDSLLKLGYTATLNFNFRDTSWYHIIDPHSISPLTEPITKDLDENTSSFPIESFGSTLWNCSTHNAGVGLLNVRNQGYPFLPQLVFSLLKGRPVVITAKKEDKTEVQNLVQALSIFVVNSTPTLETSEIQVIGWFKEPLHLKHLAHIKLIGINKKHAIPLAVLKYTTQFNFTAKTLAGPAYKGEFITKILSEKKHWPNDSTFLAYVHAQLYEFSTLACLFYHECCINPLISPNPYSNAPVSVPLQGPMTTQSLPKESLHNTVPNYGPFPKIIKESVKASHSSAEVSLKSFEKAKSRIRDQQVNSIDAIKTKFFSTHKISENDAEIIQYFAEVVKMQQSAIRHGTKKSPIIRLDYSTIHLYDNKKQRSRLH